MSDSSEPVLLQEQGLSVVALPSGVSEVTSPIRPPRTTREILANFDPEVFDLSAESTLSRFAKALLGDAGAGRITKAYFLQRLRGTLGGAHFWDLDSFYGALFSLWRLTNEIPASDPLTSELTNAEWSQIAAQDDAYRSRIEQFARALAYGGGTTGIQLVAEAVLSVHCDVYEGWVRNDSDSSTRRNSFLIVPHREVTAEERYALETVVRKIMPVGVECEVNPQGVATTTAVPLRGASADSEYWTIQSTDLNRGSIPAQRPPFTAYQGEAWSHLSSLLSISGYGTTANGIIKPNLFDTIAVRSNDRRGLLRSTEMMPFPVNQGLTTLRQILAGRSVSDGICVIHPYFNVSPAKSPLFLYMSYWFYAMPTAAPAPDLVSIRVDAYPLDAMSGSKPLDIVQYGQRYWAFWATPSRAEGDGFTESMEVRLKKPSLTNYVSFMVAHYPQHVEFQAWVAGRWVTLMERDVRDSVPSRLPSYDYTAERMRLHPQHYIEGHWLPIAGRVAHVISDRYRVTMTRIPGGTPVNENAQPVPYSLGVKSLDLGYRITSDRDIPLPSESPNGVFAEMFNVAGDTVALSVYQEHASSIVDDSGVWRSNPMPAHDAVVNLYLDLRDGNGNSQVIDRLYLEPIKSGATFNLYWSDDDTFGEFDSPATNLPTVTAGEVNYTPYGIDMAAEGASTTIAVPDYTAIPADQPWWFAMKVRPHFAHSGNADVDLVKLGDMAVTLFDDEGLGGVGLAVGGGRRKMFSFPFAPDTELVIFVGSDGHGDFTMTMAQVGDLNSTHSATVTVADLDPDLNEFAFGDTEPMLLETFAFVIDGDYPDFADLLGLGGEGLSLTNWAVTQPPDALVVGLTHNALIRFDRSLYVQDQADSTGFQGGRANFEGSLTWHPIARDYKLTKGWVEFPQIKARWLNLEFSNLIAEPIESFVPVEKVVKFFPPWVDTWNRQTDDAAAAWPGLQRAVYQSMTEVYRDSSTALAVLNQYQQRIDIYSGQTYRPTTAVALNGLAPYEALANRNEFYRFKTWQPGDMMPMWAHVGQHQYESYTSFSQEKVGFFVGLKSVAASRLDYTVDDDTVIYREAFNDNRHMADGGTWSIEDGWLESVDGVDSQVESVAFGSFDGVSGVQFATQQSEARQIIPNDRFVTRDTSFFDRFDNPNVWHMVGDGQLAYDPADTTITVDRDTSAFVPGPRTAGAFGASITGPPMRPVFAFREGEGYQPQPSTSGGLESAPAVPSEKGALRAVARVVGVRTSDTPLVLQLIGSDGETVLAESSQVINSGQTVEWGVTYEMGRFNRVNEPSFEWRQGVGGLMPSPFVLTEPAVPVVDPPAPVLDAYVTVRVVQEGASTDSWIVERVSLFDESIVWEFSSDNGATWIAAGGDIRSNPYGFVQFSEPGSSLKWRVTAYRPRVFVSALQIRPWYKDRYTAPMGLPYRGPNVSAFETEPPILNDPMFHGWNDIAPAWWWQTRGALSMFDPAGSEPVTGPDSSFVGVVVVDDVNATGDGVTALLTFYRRPTDDISMTDSVSVQLSLAESIMDNAPLSDDFAVGTYLFASRAWLHSPEWPIG